MSVKTLSSQRSLFEAGVYLGDLLEHGSGSGRFRFFRDKVWPELRRLEAQLQTMYSVDNGRPGENPVRLLGVSILQFMERLPDRQAVEALTFDVRWKCALGMDLDEVGFHPTVLVRFRERLLERGQEGVGFEAALTVLRQAGYLPKKAPQRLDSTHVLAQVARMSRLECVRETLRLALEALERQEQLARPESWPLWWERYVECRPDYKATAEALDRKMVQAGQDAQALLAWVQEIPEEKVRMMEPIRLLRRVFEENFEVAPAGEVMKRYAQPAGAVQNPHDPQAQWSTKNTIKQKEWVGYKAQIAETVEQQARHTGEPTTSVITAIVTQEAIASDKAALPVVEKAWEATGEPKPPVLYADAGYNSGAELARAEQEGRELRGPMQPAPHKDGRHSAEAFDVRVSERRAICPTGNASTNCSRVEEAKTGTVIFRFEWNRAVCRACVQRAQCLGKGQTHRTLAVGEHHDFIQSRRREQKTEAFAKEMQHRNAIEGTISELVRGYGFRKCRSRGLAKARLQNNFIAAACNIKRCWRRTCWEVRQAAKRYPMGTPAMAQA